MDKELSEIIQRINNGIESEEICKYLSLKKRDELYDYLTMLKNYGYNYKRFYNSKGEINYIPISSKSDLDSFRLLNEQTIKMEEHQKLLRILAISDIHIGSKKSREDLLDKVFNYCKGKGIHIIFICGDIIDGIHKNDLTKNCIEKISLQIEEFMEKYPRDNNILTFCVQGNHDLESLTYGYQDISEVVENFRHDIVIGNYANFTINILNSKVLLYHPIKNYYMNNNGQSIILMGHSHLYRVSSTYKNSLYIKVPTLSNLSDSIPSMLDMALFFNEGYVNNVNISQIGFIGAKQIILSEGEYGVYIKKNKEETKKNIKMKQKKRH